MPLHRRNIQVFFGLRFLGSLDFTSSLLSCGSNGLIMNEGALIFKPVMKYENNNNSLTREVFHSAF